MLRSLPGRQWAEHAPGRAAGRRCPGPAWCWSAARPAPPAGSRCSARSAAAAFLGSNVIKPYQRPQNATQSQHYLSFPLFSFYLEGSLQILSLLRCHSTTDRYSNEEGSIYLLCTQRSKGVKEKRKATKPLRQKKSCHKTLRYTLLQCGIICKHPASALVQKQ